MQVWKIGACSMLMALLAAVAAASATPLRATTKQRLDTAHAANPSTNMHPPIHPSTAVVRAFAETALQHLKGPAQRPFLKLLATLPPAAKQPGVVISTKATKNIQCSGGVCTPTAAKAVLNVNELTRLLVAGNVTIATNAVAPHIVVDAPFTWTSANTLILQAIGNITINKAVSDAGSGPLDLEYDITGGGGALSFGNKGSISFLGLANPLTIDGQSYQLAADIRTMARLIQDNPSGNFALARSYDARRDGTYTQSPIPTPFQGRFEGLGNTISNLHVESSGAQTGGLFQQIAQAAYVSSLRLGRIELLSSGDSVTGGFAGENDGTVFNVSIPRSATISTTFTGEGVCYVGGLVGFNSGTVSFSNSLATVEADYESGQHCAAGGLIGFTTGSVDHSFAVDGTVTMSGVGSEFAVGGLIGAANTDFLKTPDIASTFATGAVTVTIAATGSAGGLIGSNWGQLCCGSSSIADSSATGAVVGGSETGGFVGEDRAVIEDSVATGAVSSPGCSVCGGFAGVIRGGDVWTTSISDSESFGTVSGPGEVGGFVGSDDTPQDIFNSGWCTNSSGITDPSQGAGNLPNDPGIAPFSC